MIFGTCVHSKETRLALFDTSAVATADSITGAVGGELAFLARANLPENAPYALIRALPLALPVHAQQGALAVTARGPRLGQQGIFQISTIVISDAGLGRFRSV